MKKLSGSALRCKGNNFPHRFLAHTRGSQMMVFVVLVFVGIMFTSCKKESKESFDTESQSMNSHAEHSDGNVLDDYTGISFQTLWELQQARAHTAKYREIRNAIRDGYADISVVVPNMGYHYMKSTLVDGSFEFRKPEILVYNKEENGELRLVAVEYAVPINLSPDAAPAGFTGSADVWDRNTGFGLWLLHAWVWEFNPAGVFNPTNPLIHVH